MGTKTLLLAYLHGCTDKTGKFETKAGHGQTKVVLSVGLFAVFWVWVDVSCLFLPLHVPSTLCAAHCQSRAGQRNSSFQSNGSCQKGDANPMENQASEKGRSTGSLQEHLTGGVFCRNPAGFEPQRSLPTSTML